MGAEEEDTLEEFKDPLEESDRSKQGFGDELRPGGPSETSGFEKVAVEPHI